MAVRRIARGPGHGVESRVVMYDGPDDADLCEEVIDPMTSDTTGAQSARTGSRMTLYAARPWTRPRLMRRRASPGHW